MNQGLWSFDAEKTNLSLDIILQTTFLMIQIFNSFLFFSSLSTFLIAFTRCHTTFIHFTTSQVTKSCDCYRIMIENDSCCCSFGSVFCMAPILSVNFSFSFVFFCNPFCPIIKCFFILLFLFFLIISTLISFNF